ncbi:MAG: hypothetical protein J5971_00970 [Prevotella sp.]|nr:hypothetical protein [Prevotella sp.]
MADLKNVKVVPIALEPTAPELYDNLWLYMYSDATGTTALKAYPWNSTIGAQLATLVDGGAFNQQTQRLQMKHGPTVLFEIDLSTVGGSVPIVDWPTAGSVTIQPGMLNRWIDRSITRLNVTLGASEGSYVQEYMLEFLAGENFSFSVVGGVQWASGEEPEWNSGSRYQVSIVNRLAIAAEFTSNT